MRRVVSANHIGLHRLGISRHARTRYGTADSRRFQNRLLKEQTMWYFSWVLGLGFAVTLAVLNAMWLEHRQQ
jgi:cyd operon protein YbgT